MADRASAPASAYVPAIDGLRFFAVGSVLLFHLWRPLLPGGFVGVDVFFVLSGYLITRLLIDPHHAPTLLQFYQNRIARIAPASLLTIVVTVAAGYLVYDEQTFAYLGSAALFAAISALNLKLLFQSSYFAASQIAQPLLHFWSLAVEEQFYLFYPAALLVLRRFGLPRVLALTGAASLITCLWLTSAYPTYAFYLLPARAWELCAGGWLALRHRLHGRENALGWLGLALLIGCFVFVSEARPFPGWQAILPVAATMLMLDATRANGSFARVLSARPFVWVGLRSYSLYLWHWPVYSLTDYALWQHDWALRLPVKIALTLALSLASYHWAERPLRARLRKRNARVLAFAAFFAVVGVIGAGGLAIRNHYYLSAEGSLLDKGGYLFGQVGTRVTLVGDSESAMYAAALRDVAAREGWRLRVLAAANTNQLPGEPDTRWAAVDRWLAAERPQVTIVGYAWGDKLKDGAGLDALLLRIGALGGRAVVLLQAPVPSGPPGYEPHADGRLDVPEAGPRERAETARAVRAVAARHAGVQVVDPSALFIGPRGQLIVAEPGKAPNWYDAAHLSRTGADRVAPLLVQAVRAVR